ncbi:MAG: hypothetical protein KatS3mg111_0914 [Pirellulaceae bacterium]|nr:MAG: hypothetical protein KatS3mg111_0914 [Pirellulaceae bacterium]
MTTTTSYTSQLDSWLPDEKVIAIVRQTIEKEGEGCIEYDSGAVNVPADTTYEVVSKAFIKQPESIGFGSCFRVVVAVGGLVHDESGITKSKFGFATAWFDVGGELITIDFADKTPV